LLPGTNWVDLAVNLQGVLAIRSDHSLWSFSDSLRQVGSESSWISVTAADDLFLATKQDGSLWLGGGWPQNHFALLDGTGWTKVFATPNNEAIAIREDGSVWRWRVGLPEDWRKNGAMPPTPTWSKEPELSFKGTNWVSFNGFYATTFGVDSAGNIWDGHNRCYSELRALSPEWDCFGLVDQMGHLYWRETGLRRLKGEQGSLFKDGGMVRQMSRYSDWLTVAGPPFSIIALSEDGTVSSWHRPEPWALQDSLLAPTRKPEWSINIFDHPASVGAQ